MTQKQKPKQIPFAADEEMMARIEKLRIRLVFDQGFATGLSNAGIVRQLVAIGLEQMEARLGIDTE